jgi:hypothetical protein
LVQQDINGVSTANVVSSWWKNDKISY